MNPIEKLKRQSKGFTVAGCVFGTCMACFFGGYFSGGVFYPSIFIGVICLIMSIGCARMVNHEFTNET